MSLAAGFRRLMHHQCLYYYYTEHWYCDLFILIPIKVHRGDVPHVTLYIRGSSYLGPCGQSLPCVQARYFRSRRPVLPAPPDFWGGLVRNSFCLKVYIGAYLAAL